MASSLPKCDPERFVIEKITSANFKEVEDLDHEVFVGQNPVFLFMGVNKTAWAALEAWDSLGWDKSGCSLLMRDKQAGNQVVAFALTQVHSVFRELPPGLPAELIGECPMFEHFFGCIIPALMEAASNPAGSVNSSLAGRTLRFVAGGTKKGYEGMKLQQTLRQRVLDLAEERGYDRITVETINPATQHIWHDKFGFNILASAPFSQYTTKNGEKPFEELHVKFCIFEKVFHRRALRDSQFFCALGRLMLKLRGSLKGRAKSCVEPVVDASCNTCFCNCFPSSAPKFKSA